MSIKANVPDGDGPTDNGVISEPPPPDKVVMFYIPQPDGKGGTVDKPVYAPRQLGPNVALQYLRDVRRRGQEYAMAAIMERILGPEGMDALADYEDLTTEELQEVFKAVETHVMGPLIRAGKH